MRWKFIFISSIKFELLKNDFFLGQNKWDLITIKTDETKPLDGWKKIILNVFKCISDIKWTWTVKKTINDYYWKDRLLKSIVLFSTIYTLSITLEWNLLLWTLHKFQVALEVVLGLTHSESQNLQASKKVSQQQLLILKHTLNYNLLLYCVAWICNLISETASF